MNKLEKHIKQKLQEREIEPSNKAWQKIEAELEPHPVANNNRIYWYAVAAVFAGILIIGAIFLNSENLEQATPKIVDTTPKTNQPITPTDIEAIEKGEELINPEQEAQTTNSIDNSFAIPSTEIAEVGDPMKVDKNVMELASQMESNESQELLINQKVDEVMAQVLHLESQNRQVTDAEVDSLLRAAQREMLTEKIITETGSVNAMALLTEVEEELDQSFRDQIFEALKEGYTKLRTAVADRNN